MPVIITSDSIIDKSMNVSVKDESIQVASVITAEPD